MNTINHLVFIPHDLLSLIMKLMSSGSVFSLSRTCKPLLTVVYKGKNPCVQTIIIDTICNDDTNLFEWLVAGINRINHAQEYYEQSAKFGSLEILIYIRTKFREIGYSWDKNASFEAAKNGHLMILKYLHTNEYQANGYALDHAAENGHLEVLKYLRENRCRWSNEITWCGTACNSAAENGHLEVLKYLHENECPLNKCACSAAAARNGHLEVLKYLHENGCPWNVGTCNAAARNGHLEVLKYLHENGCIWSENACIEAAHNGHLEVLKYLHENGCPWHKDVDVHSYTIRNRRMKN